VHQDLPRVPRPQRLGSLFITIQCHRPSQRQSTLKQRSAPTLLHERFTGILLRQSGAHKPGS
jgi:hypothetical protein